VPNGPVLLSTNAFLHRVRDKRILDSIDIVVVS